MTASLAKRRLDPAYFTHPPVVRTLGPEVADLATLAGFPPDPEQEMALDVMFAIDDAGLPLVFEFACIAPRQNLKTGVLKMAVLGWLYICEQRLIVWSAHDMTPTEEAFRDLSELIENCPSMNKRQMPGPSNGIFRGNGDESIELATGQRVIFKARTTKGGARGLAGDKVVLDEAFALKPVHVGALLPTLAARPESQVAYGSSAGNAHAAHLRRIRNRGRAGGSPSLGYMEYCAPRKDCALEQCSHEYEDVKGKGCALDDQKLWRVANSAMDRRISIEKMQAFREAEPPEEFMREHMGWWEEPAEETVIPTVFTEDQWLACKDPNSAPVDPVAVGVFLLPDRSAAAIAIAGRREDWKIHVEVVMARRHGDIHTLPGTSWIAPRVKELKDDFKPCAILLGGAADSLAAAMTELEVEAITVNGMDAARACGQFYDAVTDTGDDSDPTLRDLGYEDFHDVVTAATKRELRRGWVWSDGTDPRLEAVTLAVHGLIEHGPKEPVETEVWGFFE